MAINRFRVVLACAGLFVLQAAVVVAADHALDPVGRPKPFEKGKHTTFALWEDEGVWHLRTSVKAPGKGKMQKIVFTGRVAVKGDKLIAGEFQGLEKKAKAKDADWIEMHADGKGFDFQFSTFSNNTDGVNFKTGSKAESVSFKLLTSGDDDPKRIMIGAKGVHPQKAEFTFPVKPR
ncbi:MAG: hypothetical protein J0I06_25985 [Planctomycetes bacterium]|nr:hypothetical protein [Planctomycetota bacterium]